MRASRRQAAMQYFKLAETDALPDIGQLAPFKAVLAIEDSVSSARRDDIANWLVAMGGMYVMICGADCEDWEASLRQANLARLDLEDMNPREFVMITTHQQERLRSVFWHAKKYAHHTHVRIENILTLHVGKQDRSVEYLAMFDKA